MELQDASVPTPRLPAAHAVLALRSDVVATVLDDAAVLLDLETTYFYTLNASGWALVQLFEAGAPVDDVETQAQRWGANPGEARRFVDELWTSGLLEPVGDALFASSAPIEPPQPWMPPTVDRQAEPLHQVVVNAFDPWIPVAE